MGNLCSGKQEEDFILDLIGLSNDTLTSEIIYDIMMKTNCKAYLVLANELIGLYKRFVELDIDKRGRISNQEFLMMKELYYNPFRHRLKLAFPTKSEEHIRNLSLKGGDESFEKATLVPPNYNSNKISPEPEEVSEIDRIPYIDFSQFCQYLGVFCPRSTSDLKFNCNSYLVLFRLFDNDEDGNLTKEDLHQSVKLLVSGNLNPNEINEVIGHIFEENDKEDKGYLTKEEFQKSLWMTDFSQKMSLQFAV